MKKRDMVSCGYDHVTRLVNSHWPNKKPILRIHCYLAPDNLVRQGYSRKISFGPIAAWEETLFLRKV